MAPRPRDRPPVTSVPSAALRLVRLERIARSSGSATASYFHPGPGESPERLVRAPRGAGAKLEPRDKGTADMASILQTAAAPPIDALDFLRLADGLSDEERLIRDNVRAYVREQLIPQVGDWFERGLLPRELAGQLGDLGVLGMHLEGYGCAGASATAYGIVCQELEAGDSGLRSFVSVQGSLAMFAIWRFGSEEQKQEWLPRMAAGEAIGCFGLTEPDAGSDPGSMRTTAKRSGDDWVLNGTKMWITNGSLADVAVVWARTDERSGDEREARGSGIRGFLVPRGTPGFSTQDIHQKLSLRASVTSELIL